MKPEKLQEKGNAGIPSLFIAKPKIEKLDSQSLRQVGDFLEKMKRANQDLQQQIERGDNVDIEAVQGEQHVEMELGLGVFDLKMPEEHLNKEAMFEEI